MLRLKRAELQHQVEQEQARLARVEVRLRDIEQEGKMPTHDVIVKCVERQRITSRSDVIRAYDAQGPL
jgi:hypothetical protein